MVPPGAPRDRPVLTADLALRGQNGSCVAAYVNFALCEGRCDAEGSPNNTDPAISDCGAGTVVCPDCDECLTEFVCGFTSVNGPAGPSVSCALFTSGTCFPPAATCGFGQLCDQFFQCVNPCT